MHAFLVREHYSGGQHPTALMAKLRGAPRARIGEIELAARRRLVLSYVAMIRTLNTQIKQLEGEIRTQVRAHPDGPIFLSLFKSPASVITAAELLAEIGDCRERYPTRDALAADAGQAAVAYESGKWKTAGFRRACNKRLRVAFCRLADASRHWHPWAQDLYAQARQRGHEHPRAIRTLGRAWCRVVWQCWRNHTPYDPARHRALQRHITVTIPSSSGPVPDLAATQRMAGATLTQRAARRPSAQRLTANRQPLPKPGG
jgi:transposase